MIVRQYLRIAHMSQDPNKLLVDIGLNNQIVSKQLWLPVLECDMLVEKTLVLLSHCCHH